MRPSFLGPARPGRRPTSSCILSCRLPQTVRHLGTAPPRQDSVTEMLLWSLSSLSSPLGPVLITSISHLISRLGSQ